ncbi:rRNA maturation RNase YbeY [Chromobacterium subtsugae]|uniref:Endoribonuclease YbeY n=1 Tax=Chromobacterium subtsugae TaxID=251747 RepID=A0ABS7F8X5_9NEIS|nr:MULTISPECIES: rRNA maturation RNase YbeY [Chromobacterium]KUM03416.1 rRNA maturation RNase YbeY [Chromobacterium subtsugae]KZE86060.1 rRNA maturation RNase YbeY [Chromobacterium sp. F49]MBW7564920.1 rRNA maturation RNase YbeY [Chromobacterium subtsugae]MBW8286553.1 rRNA maturation RNase YbeY [Chromobacterium subtsugae]OBU85029.1 endoribonuclease YbeY [Chromobacterium subtsugae]
MKQAKRHPLLARLRARLELTLDVRSDAALPPPALIRRACQAALQRGVEKAQISIVIVDAAEGRQLNNDYRGKDYATNVLSFALNEGEPVAGLPLFGDLVLCAPVVEKEAAEQNKDLMAHYAHLLVHGMLHLQGFDHEEDDEAEAMEALETVIVKQLGYPDPYHEEQF